MRNYLQITKLWMMIGIVKNISVVMSLIENMVFDAFDMNTNQEETDDNLMT